MSLCTSLFDLHISLWSFRVDFLGLSDRKQFLYSSRRQEITWRKKPGFITLIPFPMFSSTIQQECFKFPQTASHISECLLRRCSSSERALGTWDPSVPRSPEKPWKKSNVWNKWACFLQIFLYATCMYMPPLFICLPRAVAWLNLPLAAPETHSLLIGISTSELSSQSIFTLVEAWQDQQHGFWSSRSWVTNRAVSQSLHN